MSQFAAILWSHDGFAELPTQNTAYAVTVNKIDAPIIIGHVSLFNLILLL